MPWLDCTASENCFYSAKQGKNKIIYMLSSFALALKNKSQNGSLKSMFFQILLQGALMLLQLILNIDFGLKIDLLIVLNRSVCLLLH